MANERIKLNSPLKWHGDADLKEGLLTEIGQTYFLLKASQPTATKLHNITVTLPDGKEMLFGGSIHQLVFPNCKFLVATEYKQQLNDFLAIIRKNQHIDICANTNVEASDSYTGFEEYNFIPDPLPDLNYDELDISRHFLGKKFQAPLLITGMTGGVAAGQMINDRLAQAASYFKIPMGVGSQRLALENTEYEKIFQIKHQHPDVFLIGNLGFAQLLRPDFVDICRNAVDMIAADALAIHLNIVQECIQVEGDRNFKNLLERIAGITAKLQVPVIVKEVGCGITLGAAAKLIQAGVDAIDIGGKGGTSWGYIEGLRSSDLGTQELGKIFRNWGIPTAFSLARVRQNHPKIPLIATGGIRDGMMVAKAIGLGANMTGLGLPLLKAALESEKKLHATLDTIIRGLKVTMMATGSQNLDQLQQKLCIGQPYRSSHPTIPENLP